MQIDRQITQQDIIDLIADKGARFTLIYPHCNIEVVYLDEDHLCFMIKRGNKIIQLWNVFSYKSFVQYMNNVVYVE